MSGQPNASKLYEDYLKYPKSYRLPTPEEWVQEIALKDRVKKLEVLTAKYRAALENVLLAIDHEDYYNDAVFDEAREALKEATNES